MAGTTKTQRWRRLLRQEAPSSLESANALESLQVPDSPLDRIARAKEAMQRVIKDHFGGDSALAQAVEQLAISGEEAISILDQAEQEPSDNHFSALEAIVAFDGTRPSFLVKQQGIDFSSSYNTGSWSADLQPFLDQLGKVISCVGRVEVGEQHIGTAFLVTPTLAITNRHVAQAIAAIGDGKVTLKPNIFLDFGREQWDAKKSFDRRKVQAIPFVGKDPIVTPISHAKLDLSVLRVAASELGGDLGQRHMTIAHVARGDFGAAGFVTTTGYPGSAELVPNKLKSQYEEVLARLLEGDGGAKRFAPGKPMSTDGINGLADWTILHDATTVGGNSGSPVAMLQNSANPSGIVTVGLHYGGDWGGERSNFAHLLALTGPGVGYGENKTFAEFCTAEGIGL